MTKRKTELQIMGLPLTVDLTVAQANSLEKKRSELETLFRWYVIGGRCVVTHKREDISLDCGNDFLIYL